ncbi:MAG: acylphosphatase [Lachnospiraceae bacterium]|nr:acylphosphatase [Lachnospiraceae bacterium]
MDLKENAIIRERIRVSGRVQGVGFRYRAQHAAKSYGVKGFVRNEYDGSVFMELQGTERQITDMLITLQNSPYIRMDQIDASRIPVKEGERGFRVQYI